MGNRARQDNQMMTGGNPGMDTGVQERNRRRAAKNPGRTKFMAPVLDKPLGQTPFVPLQPSSAEVPNEMPIRNNLMRFGASLGEPTSYLGGSQTFDEGMGGISIPFGSRPELDPNRSMGLGMTSNMQPQRPQLQSLGFFGGRR